MPRFRLTIEYDGAGFLGWQRQKEGPSIQQSIEEAIEKFCGHETRLHVAGRTDAGVHAWGQIAHCDLPIDHDAMQIRAAIDFHLKPARIAIRDVELVADEFHARFDAIGRRYHYYIHNHPAKPALRRGYVWHVPQALDVAVMQKAAKDLIGYHDFSSFRDADCQAKSPIKTLSYAGLSWEGDLLRFDVLAPSFLHHQVRNMIGTLAAIGTGRFAPDAIPQILAAKDRSKAGPTAPAYGLYFDEVFYEEARFAECLKNMSRSSSRK